MTETEETDAGPRAAVAALLRRAGPGEEVMKEELLAGTAGDPSALREILADMEEDGEVLTTSGGGYRWLGVEDRALDAADEREGGQEDAPEKASEAPEAGAEGPEEGATVTRYGVTVLHEVSFYPEVGEGETEDEAAQREARLILAAAGNGILAEYPDLPLTGQVARLDAFDQVRRVE